MYVNEIPELVEVENGDAGVLADEVAPLERTHDAVPAGDERTQAAEPGLARQVEQAGVAFEVAAEAVQCLPLALEFKEIGTVGLEVLQAHGIVDVQDGGTGQAEAAPEGDVLIAALAVALVEGTALEARTADEEVGGAELAEGVLVAALGRVRGLAVALIAVAQVAAPAVAAGYADAPVDDVVLVRDQIAAEVVVVRQVHVAVDEEQPGVAAVGGEVVAGGGAAAVLRFQQQPAVGQAVDLLVKADDVRLV